MAKNRSNARPRQVVSEEVQRSLLELIQRKFYDGQTVRFAKDQRALLNMVIYWPARYWFREREVEIPNDRYLEILSSVLIDAAAHQKGPLHYPPAYLSHSLKKHFAHHGEKIYDEAKSTRSLATHALTMLGKLPTKAQDNVVEQFTAADRLLQASKKVGRRAVQRGSNRPVNGQLGLL